MTASRRLVLGAAVAPLVFACLVSWIPLIVGIQGGITFGVVALYFAIAYALAAAVILLPFLSFRRSMREAGVRHHALYKLTYLAVVFAIAAIIASGLNGEFRSGGWLAIAIFATVCANIFLLIVKPERESGSASNTR